MKVRETLTYWIQYFTESRTYNSRLQMTRLTATNPCCRTPDPSSNVDLEYRYSTTGQNNGQAASMKDWVTGEDVTYTYDKLNRLTSAVTAGPEWGQSYTFDGFGNLTAQTVTKGSAPSMSLSVSGTTNRIISTGFSYAANGTMLTMPNWQGGYDMEGRLTDVTQSLNGSEAYEYDGSNRRVWTLQPTGEVFWFYGPDGKRLMKCALGVAPAPYGWGGLWITTKWPITYFLGQVVSGEGGTTFEGVAADRLGSVRQAPSALSWWSVANTSSYFPYGQARTGGSTWATYQPSTISATMYAMNQEYSAVYGRFLTPDPYMGSAHPIDPATWNRYSYVLGDPVNLHDPSGLCPPGMIDATDPTVITRIIASAESYLNQGIDYSSGRHDRTDENGNLVAVDCSGFVSLAIGLVEYSEPGVEPDFTFASGQTSSYFSEDSSGVQPGDILWFPGHVVIVKSVSADGIVFLGSQSSTGPAEVDTSKNSYWASQLKGAKAYKPCVPESAVKATSSQAPASGGASGGKGTTGGGAPEVPWWQRATQWFAEWIRSIPAWDTPFEK